jgi:hypothetical protein
VHALFISGLPKLPCLRLPGYLPGSKQPYNVVRYQ